MSAEARCGVLLAPAMMALSSILAAVPLLLLGASLCQGEEANRVEFDRLVDWWAIKQSIDQPTRQSTV